MGLSGVACRLALLLLLALLALLALPSSLACPTAAPLPPLSALHFARKREKARFIMNMARSETVASELCVPRMVILPLSREKALACARRLYSTAWNWKSTAGGGGMAA